VRNFTAGAALAATNQTVCQPRRLYVCIEQLRRKTGRNRPYNGFPTAQRLVFSQGMRRRHPLSAGHYAPPYPLATLVEYSSASIDLTKTPDISPGACTQRARGPGHPDGTPISTITVLEKLSDPLVSLSWHVDAMQL
jgi:hypothetical protein